MSVAGESRYRTRIVLSVKHRLRSPTHARGRPIETRFGHRLDSSRRLVTWKIDRSAIIALDLKSAAAQWIDDTRVHRHRFRAAARRLDTGRSKGNRSWICPARSDSLCRCSNEDRDSLNNSIDSLIVGFQLRATFSSASIKSRTASHDSEGHFASRSCFLNRLS